MGADTPDFVQQKASCVWQSHCGTGASEVYFPFTAVYLLKCVGVLGLRGANLSCVAMSILCPLVHTAVLQILDPSCLGLKLVILACV